MKEAHKNTQMIIFVIITIIIIIVIIIIVYCWLFFGTPCNWWIFSAKGGRGVFSSILRVAYKLHRLTLISPWYSLPVAQKSKYRFCPSATAASKVLLHNGTKNSFQYYVWVCVGGWSINIPYNKGQFIHYVHHRLSQAKWTCITPRSDLI